MRTVLLIFLGANVLFFAWSQYLSGSGATADGVLARRNEPDKLKIVPPAEPPRVAAGPRCLEWGPFAGSEYLRAEKTLEPLALGARVAPRRSSEPAPGWWVFIPSQGSRESALKKAAELKAMGVTDYFIMGEEADTPWSLSLGVYRSEQAALARLTAVRDQGVRSALVGSRDTLVPRLWLQVKEADAALEARLRETARQFELGELRPCR
jgi:hypothetical protein